MTLCFKGKAEFSTNTFIIPDDGDVIFIFKISGTDKVFGFDDQRVEMPIEREPFGHAMIWKATTIHVFQSGIAPPLGALGTSDGRKASGRGNEGS